MTDHWIVFNPTLGERVREFVGPFPDSTTALAVRNERWPHLQVTCIGPELGDDVQTPEEAEARQDARL